MTQKTKWHIAGRVIDATTRQGIPGLLVEAWDADGLLGEFVAYSSTRGDGGFDMEFDETRFQKLNLERERYPDLFFIIRSRGVLILSTKGDIFWNWDEHLERLPDIEISSTPLPQPQPQPQNIEVAYFNVGRAPQTVAGAPTAASLEEVVDDALRAVLGQLPRTSDRKSFLTALDKTFISKMGNGGSVYEYAPTSYVGVVDGGARLTGAQASLYIRAKSMLEESLRLLDGLKPLRVDFDPQDAEAIRSVVRTQLTELVNEFGRDEGPYVQHVNDLIKVLRDGYRIDQMQVPGAIDELRDQFGFGPGTPKVTTLEEEQNLTNFITLRDYLELLYESWADYQANKGAFFGTDLRLLRRALQATAESVSAVESAMDAVGFHATERENFQIGLPGEKPEDWLTVAAGLSWIESYTSEKALRLIDEGGKRGAKTIIPTLKTLHAWVASLKNNSDQRIQNQTVQTELGDLRQFLDKAVSAATEITCS